MLKRGSTSHPPGNLSRLKEWILILNEFIRQDLQDLLDLFQAFLMKAWKRQLPSAKQYQQFVVRNLCFIALTSI